MKPETRRPRDSGFTLIELLVVVLILSLLAPMLPNYRKDRLLLREQARGLAFDLRMLRLEAMRTGAPTAFASRANAYVTQPGSRLHPLAKGVLMTMDSMDKLGLGNEDIAFFPDGEATEGTVDLIRNHSRIMIHIDWLDGRVIIHE